MKLCHKLSYSKKFTFLDLTFDNLTTELVEEGFPLHVFIGNPLPLAISFLLSGFTPHIFVKSIKEHIGTAHVYSSLIMKQGPFKFNFQDKAVKIIGSVKLTL